MTSEESKALVIGLLSGAAITVLAGGLFYSRKPSHVEPEEHQEALPTQQTEYVDGVAGLIGNTPLMKIKSLSEATGCLVLGKAEVKIAITWIVDENVNKQTTPLVFKPRWKFKGSSCSQYDSYSRRKRNIKTTYRQYGV